MSITVRLWSAEDLEKIGKDPELTTVFMNASTFSGKEIAHYPYRQRRAFIARLDTQDPDEDDIKVYATSPAMARWFIEQEYNGNIESMHEIITKVREVKVPRRKTGRKSSGRSPGGSVRGLRG